MRLLRPIGDGVADHERHLGRHPARGQRSPVQFRHQQLDRVPDDLLHRKADRGQRRNDRRRLRHIVETDHGEFVRNLHAVPVSPAVDAERHLVVPCEDGGDSAVLHNPLRAGNAAFNGVLSLENPARPELRAAFAEKRLHDADRRIRPVVHPDRRSDVTDPPVPPVPQK